MKEIDQTDIIKNAVRLLIKHCPRLISLCYWAGTAAIAIEELKHRQSFDLDFHTRKALLDIRPIVDEIKHAFPNRIDIVQAPDQFGSGFRGILSLPDGSKITIEILSNYEDVPGHDLVKSNLSPEMYRISLKRYLADKIQCVVERVEARDLVDIYAVFKYNPSLKSEAKKLLAQQDALLIAERLLAWTDKAIKLDLDIYKDIKIEHAIKIRDLLLNWLKNAGEKNK